MLLRAGEGEGGDTPYKEIYVDDSFGWSDLAPNLTIVDIDGGHSSMLQEQFVGSLFAALRPYLSKEEISSARAVELAVADL
jgi:hypothetical protein